VWPASIGQVSYPRARFVGGLALVAAYAALIDWSGHPQPVLSVSRHAGNRTSKPNTKSLFETALSSFNSRLCRLISTQANAYSCNKLQLQRTLLKHVRNRTNPCLKSHLQPGYPTGGPPRLNNLQVAGAEWY
jgi:hypothetical protein